MDLDRPGEANQPGPLAPADVLDERVPATIYVRATVHLQGVGPFDDPFTVDPADEYIAVLLRGGLLVPE